MAEALLELRLLLGERVARAGGAVGRRKGLRPDRALIGFILGVPSAVPPLPLSSRVDFLTSAICIAERSASAVVSLPRGAMVRDALPPARAPPDPQLAR